MFKFIQKIRNYIDSPKIQAAEALSQRDWQSIKSDPKKYKDLLDAAEESMWGAVRSQLFDQTVDATIPNPAHNVTKTYRVTNSPRNKV